MELWIRSQDRDYLEKVEKIYFWESSPGRYVIEGNSELGIYKTKERALEVLDEIQDRIMVLNMISTANSKDELVDIANSLGVKKMQGSLMPYQMPEE